MMNRRGMVSNMAVNITKRTSTTNTTSAPGRKILYIVEHYTAGVSSRPGAALDTASWFSQSRAQASADFIVDDEYMVQFNPDPRNRYCWAVGGSNYGNKGGSLYGIARNANSISIEICSTNKTGKMTQPNDNNYYFTEAVVKRAEELTKYLMKEYGIDADHVIRHYDVNGKPCPGIKGWNAECGDESKWKAFKACLTGKSSQTPTVDTGMQASVLKNLTEAQVVAKVGVLFTADQKKSGIMACVSMAQFILESGYGHTDLAQNANNCFGMKKSLSGNTWSGSTWDGKSIYTKQTKEQKADGTEYTITADFRKYPNMADSIADHSAYLLGAMNGSKKRYDGLKGCTDYKKAVQIIKDGGYATDVSYVSKLCSIIEKWNLAQYNVTKSEIVTPSTEQNILPAVPFTVEVIIDDLYYRSEGSMNGNKLGYTGKGVFTIVEVKNGWGKLKSGAGWIYLLNSAYCKVKGTDQSASTKSKFPYSVRVLVSDLRIRKGAGTNTASVGYTGKGVFTIVDEKQGVIDSKGTIGTWGKLKSGAGWICLAYKKYTQKI